MKILIFAFLTLAHCALADADQMQLADGKIILSAKAAWQVFNVNPLKVEHTIGKRKAIFGNVEKIARDSDGNPYILLMVTGELGSVKCTFTDKDADALRALPLAGRVIVEGTVKGMTLSILVFTDCRFVK